MSWMQGAVTDAFEDSEFTGEVESETGRDYFAVIKLFKNGKDLGTVEVIEQHNCCGIYVLSEPDPSSLEDFPALIEGAELFARKSGYTTFLYTGLKGDVEAQQLLKAGWKEVFSFVNERTDNELGIYVKNLLEEEA